MYQTDVSPPLASAGVSFVFSVCFEIHIKVMPPLDPRYITTLGSLTRRKKLSPWLPLTRRWQHSSRNKLSFTRCNSCVLSSPQPTQRLKAAQCGPRILEFLRHQSKHIKHTTWVAGSFVARRAPSKYNKCRRVGRTMTSKSCPSRYSELLLQLDLASEPTPQPTALYIAAMPIPLVRLCLLYKILLRRPTPPFPDGPAETAPSSTSGESVMQQVYHLREPLLYSSR